MVDAADAMSAELLAIDAVAAAMTDSGDSMSFAMLAALALAASMTDANDSMSSAATTGHVVVAMITDDDDEMIGELAATIERYPPFKFFAGTKPAARSGLRARYPTNGTVRPRALSSAMRRDLQLVHEELTLEQWNLLKQFETTNREREFFYVEYTPEGVTLKCCFDDPPFSVRKSPNTYPIAFDVTSRLRQVD